MSVEGTRYRALAVSSSNACAQPEAAGAAVRCWGMAPNGWTPPPDGEMSALTAGISHFCGERVDGQTACWGSISTGAGLVPARADPKGRRISGRSVSASFEGACALDAQGQGTCWRISPRGILPLGSSEPADGPVVRAVTNETCLLFLGKDGRLRTRTGAMPETLGPGMLKRMTLDCGAVPDGTFRDVAINLGAACGLRKDGGVTCWEQGKWTANRRSFRAPEGKFVAIASHAFGHVTCGIREGSRDVACWGCEEDTESANWCRQDAAGPFQAVSVGSDYVCAIRGDGRIACWGMCLTGRCDPG